MKARINTGNIPNYEPGRARRRELRRNFNKGMGNKRVSQEQFDQILLWTRLKNGHLTEKDADRLNKMGVNHYDNAELFPNGTEVKLNYEKINKHTHSEFTPEYWEWIEENKDNVFHLTREEDHNSLVCLEEDNRWEGKGGYFDMFADLLVQDPEGNWVEPSFIEGAMGDYVDLDTTITPEAAENTEENIETQSDITSIDVENTEKNN